MVVSKLKTIKRLGLYLMKAYFRIEVEGLEHIPRKGKGLIVPNHSGFAGVDALLLTFMIKRETKRRPRILAHRAYFDYSEKLKDLSEGHGLRRASVASAVETLSRDQLLIVFPEGEAGNFKPSFRRYELQPFRTGYLRMAIEARAPVIPCLIVGAEETHLNLGNIDLTGLAKNIRIPLPVNFWPLPAKWKIRILPPIPPEALKPEWLGDPERLQAEAARLRSELQSQLEELERSRPFIFSEPTRKLADSVMGILERLKR